MRREFIYQHRSVRSFPISRKRAWVAFALAVVISSAVAYWGPLLIGVHDRLSWWVLQTTGIPATGARALDVFPFLGQISAPIIPFESSLAHPFRTFVILAVCLAAFVSVYVRVPLGRNFVVFLMILVCAPAVVFMFNPSFDFDCSMFEQTWLRGEILVWILLPWVSAFLYILTLPSLGTGLTWLLVTEVYAILWSAIRFAFCLGALHFTGIMFLPVLWFCFGVLFDLVYVLLFYSLALNLSSKKTAGERIS